MIRCYGLFNNPCRAPLQWSNGIIVAQQEVEKIILLHGLLTEIAVTYEAYRNEVD